MSERTYYDGKYTVKARTDGGLEFLRYGEAWPAADDLRFSNLVGAMFREQLDADAEIAALRAELSRAVKLLQRFEKFYGKPTPTLRDDVHDFLAERREV